MNDFLQKKLGVSKTIPLMELINSRDNLKLFDTFYNSSLDINIIDIENLNEQCQ